MHTGTLLLTLAATLANAVTTPSQQPTATAKARPATADRTCKDKTGIRWALPFTTALDEATRRERLLLIKPIAFGTEKSGGW